jgi:large subunit ribosomal protein L19
MNKIQQLQRENMKTTLPEFGIGDTLKVEVLIVEGDKKRSQAFTGTVIARNGQGIAESVTLRRVQGGYGVERVLPLHSPNLAGIEVIRKAAVRRSKLYYLRDVIGKAAKVKEQRYDA